MTKSQKILRIMTLTRNLRNDEDMPEEVVDYASMWAYSYESVYLLMTLIHEEENIFDKIAHITALTDLLDEIETDFEVQNGPIL
jgi:hypothetical protein